MTTTFETYYQNSEQMDSMALLIAPRVEKFVQRLLSIPSYRCSGSHSIDFFPEIAGTHYPLSDYHIEHINRVLVNYVMLRNRQWGYFLHASGVAFSSVEAAAFEDDLEAVAELFDGGRGLLHQPKPLKVQLIFALAVLQDVGIDAFTRDTGHGLRGGLLAEKVLSELKDRLNLDDEDITLGRLIVEHHSMPGKIVQGEGSAFEAYNWLEKRFDDEGNKKTFLAYLLLLNCMDITGDNHSPYLLNHYWIERCIKFSKLHILKRYSGGSGSISQETDFAVYRLRELARKSVHDEGVRESKEEFHGFVGNELEKLSPELRQRMGEIRIEDALQLIFDINHYGTKKIGGWTDIYADVYTRLFKTMAQLSIEYDRHTIAYNQGENTKAGSASMSFIYRLLDRLKQDDNILPLERFEPKDDRLEFTIDKLGKVTNV